MILVQTAAMRTPPASLFAAFLPLLLGCFSAFLAAPSQAAEKPNILLIMTDDQGYWDTGATGNPHISTPNMDRISAEGVSFPRFYAAPVCAPTRAGLMTGRYYLRTGLYNTRFGGDTMGKDEITVAELLKTGGYRTGIFGKWHLGKYPGYQPQDRGFDEFVGHYHGHIERYQFPDQIVHNGEPVEARGYVSDLFADCAMDFMEHSSQTLKQPFFCYLAFNAPHSPWLLDTSHYGQENGDKLLMKYLEKGLPIREARIYALVERVDINIGRILAKLDELELSKDTLVVFMSDNGGVSKYWQGDIRSNKASVYEGGVRVPFFARWPGTIPAGSVVNGQGSHVDLLPTFCELAGVELPQDRTIDGKSLVSLLKTGKGETHHEYVYHTWDRYFPNPEKRWSISDQRYKLLCQVGKDADTPSQSDWKLFDLQNDPHEDSNIAVKNQEIVERLRTEFLRWFGDCTKGITYEPIPIPVGHPDENPSEIQPSWATWHGDNINYTFDGYDWDTIDGWKTPGEYAEWNLDVVTAGDYEVLARYGCRADNVGGKIRLSAGDSSLEFTPVSTQNSEVFQEFSVGTLSLKEGQTTLKAEILEAPNGEPLRLNQIYLKKLGE